MTGNPYISTRKYIKWGDQPANENTSTLVLTSKKRYFVDVRVYKPADETQPELPTDPKDVEGLKRLEWGFCGISYSTPAIFTASGELEKPAHSTWVHWVDSKSTEVVQDEGDIFPPKKEDLNKTDVLETGEMINPGTGKLEKYEELWDHGPVGKVLNESKYSSWVLVLKDTESKPLGIIIRIGEWIQGVLRTGNIVSVVRWRWTEIKGWECVTAIGQLEIPAEAFKQEDLSESQIFKMEDGKCWICEEEYGWN